MPGNPPTDELAGVAIDNVSRRFPYAAHHVQAGESDLKQPADLHPSFASSFDWHSSVHMHWLLATLTESVQRAGWRDRAVALLTDHLDADKLAVEAAYLRHAPSWERPYGWAWAAELVVALADARIPELSALAPGAAPLADAVFDLALDWLPTAPEPVRHGLHTNTAFGLKRLLHAARRLGRGDVADEIIDAAQRFYLGDVAWAFAQERSGQDFLSPGFAEADLMLDVLPEDELASWLPQFLSGLNTDYGAASGARVLAPVRVLDPADGYQAHLYGLGLTVAASGLRAAEQLKDSAPGLAGPIRTAVPALMAPGLTAAVSDEYMASHWLATFAWQAHLQAEQSGVRQPWSAG